jgi:ABC-type multidrug transport system fused ATPase/permease subunit
MLFALDEPAAGHIEINGVDLRSLSPESLRSTVSFVCGSEVIPGTIIDNVHLHRPNISAADVREALRRVGLWEELMNLPQGLETELSARGAPLSQSQIVRLVLARGIAGNPRLLLIDGTLDALPDSLLLPVFRALCGAEGERTIILVTGRTALRDECPRSFQLGPNLTHDASEAGGSESPIIPLQNMACNR